MLKWLISYWQNIMCSVFSNICCILFSTVFVNKLLSILTLFLSISEPISYNNVRVKFICCLSLTGLDFQLLLSYCIFSDFFFFFFFFFFCTLLLRRTGCEIQASIWPYKQSYKGVEFTFFCCCCTQEYLLSTFSTSIFICLFLPKFLNSFSFCDADICWAHHNQDCSLCDMSGK